MKFSPTPYNNESLGWAIEAKSFDPEGNQTKHFYTSGLTQSESREKHRQLSLSHEWASIRSWKFGNNE